MRPEKKEKEMKIWKKFWSSVLQRRVENITFFQYIFNKGELPKASLKQTCEGLCMNKKIAYNLSVSRGK